MEALVLGATGLCGGGFVRALLESNVSRVYTITRRELKINNEKLNCIVEESTDRWDQEFPGVDWVFSGLATTRGAAGGLENQRKVDHDMVLRLAKVAKERGANTFVLVSSSGASETSIFPYFKMKGEVERDIIALGFERTIILRPGPLIGERDNDFKGLGNGVANYLGRLAYRSWAQRLMMYPVSGDDVGQAGVKLAYTLGSGVHIISSSDILKYA